MITFKYVAAQGDVHFKAIEKLPKGLRRVEPVNNQLVVTHSETGHNHIMDATGATMYESDNPFTCFLYIEQPTALEHLRPFDTHAPIMFQPGNYEVRRQREHVPEGFRRVED